MNRVTTAAQKTAVFITVIFLLTFLFETNLSFAEKQQSKNYEKVVAHGGGAYQGYDTTNSVEAVNQAVQNGYRLIELDMEISDDQKIIMLHDWDRTTNHYLGTSFDRKITQDQFLQFSVHGLLEVLTFDKLTSILDRNPQIKIITDTKGDNFALLQLIADDYPAYQDRMIPQIYQYEEYEAVKALGYRNIILTLYAQTTVDSGRAARFFRDNDLYAVAMPDYMAEKGLCRDLANQGVPVYVHPVNTMEKAQYFFGQGACGVYSGSILPEELDGFEKDYYLTFADHGKPVKLTDQTVQNLKECKLTGLRPGDKVKFLIDGNLLESSQFGLPKLEEGKHALTIEVRDIKENKKGSLEYWLWKGKDGLRIVHKKYGYRLDEIKKANDFDTVMETNGVSEDVIDLLKRSLIASAGVNTYYNNGVPGEYMNGKEKLSVQKSSAGKLLLPLGVTAMELKAESVTMDKGRDVVITVNQEKYRSCIGSYMIRNGFRVTRIRTPITLYLNKAMADGEIYQYLTGRDYLEADDLIVILPEHAGVSKEMESQLLAAAHKLYNQ